MRLREESLLECLRVRPGSRLSAVKQLPPRDKKLIIEVSLIQEHSSDLCAIKYENLKFSAMQNYRAWCEPR